MISFDTEISLFPFFCKCVKKRAAKNKREVISISFVLKQKNFSRQNCGSLYCCHRATLSTNHVTVVTLLTAIYSRYAFGTCVVEGLS